MNKWPQLSVIVLAAATAPATQSLQPVSAEDLLNVKTASVLDFSDDGRKIAVGGGGSTTTRRRTIAATATQPTLRRRWWSCW